MIKKKFHFVTQEVVVEQNIRKVKEMLFEQLENDGNFPKQDDDVFDDTYDNDTIPITIKVATDKQFQLVKEAIEQETLDELLGINSHRSYTRGLNDNMTCTDPVFGDIKIDESTLTVTMNLTWDLTSDT
jgi:hypothetical protein